MWFKQAQLFQLPDSERFLPESILEKLPLLAFTSCLPSMYSSMGWTTPIEEEGASLIRAMNGYIMLCLQIEEKILPSTVVQQELADKIKQIEITENRKIRQQEKMRLKEEIITTLLPRAFSKFTKVYAFIDSKNHWLVLGTTNPKKTEQFLSLFKKTITDKVKSYELKKLSSMMTHWLKQQNYPSSFAIEKACVLHDPNQQSRIVRCQQQDLFANSIQSLIKEGCEVKQLALSWHDQINFVLGNDFSLQSIKYADEVTAQSDEMEAETKQQQFDADFFIMSRVLSDLLKELTGMFEVPKKVEEKSAIKEEI